MQIGKCKLCQTIRELSNSHYLARELYLRTRTRSRPNGSPVAFGLGAEPRRSQEQVKDNVLCHGKSGCEELFNKNGESWVLANIASEDGKRFPLRDALTLEAPLRTEVGVKLYSGSTLKAFDMDKLVYFALSVFWRGAVHDWKFNGRPLSKIDLGTYEEPTRQFLFGVGPYPKELAISVIIWPSNDIPNAALFPAADPSAWPRYSFYVLGIGFRLEFGDGVPPQVRARCAQTSPERMISIDTTFAEMVTDAVQGRSRTRGAGNIQDMLKVIDAIQTKHPKNRPPPESC